MISKILRFFKLSLVSELDKYRVQSYERGVKIKNTTREFKDKINSLTTEINNLKLQIPSSKKHQDDSKLKAWSKRVREVGQCDICGSTTKLTAHHLWDKKTHPTLKYQDENGVCLCLKCHNTFHKMYTSNSQTSPAIYNKFKIHQQNQDVLYK